MAHTGDEQGPTIQDDHSDTDTALGDSPSHAADALRPSQQASRSRSLKPARCADIKTMLQTLAALEFARRSFRLGPLQRNDRPRCLRLAPGDWLTPRDLLDSIGQIVRLVVTISVEQDLERHAEIVGCLP